MIGLWAVYMLIRAVSRLSYVQYYLHLILSLIVLGAGFPVFGQYAAAPGIGLFLYELFGWRVYLLVKRKRNKNGNNSDQASQNN